MSDFFKSVVESLAANLLMTVPTAVRSVLSHHKRTKRELEELLSNNESLERLIQLASTAFAKKLQKSNLVQFEESDKPTFANDLTIFIASDYMSLILRQLYASRLIIDSENSPTFASIQSDLVSEFESRFPASKGTGAATALFDLLMRCTEKVLRIAIDKNILAAHEAMSMLRYNTLSKEVRKIGEAVAMHYAFQEPPISQILDWETRYRVEVGKRHETISPASLDKTRRVPIDKLYVPPDLSRSDRVDRRTKRIILPQFLNQNYRSVVLGDPGGGKTSLVSKIAHQAISRYSQKIFRGHSLTPIVVSMRKYEMDVAANRCSIVEHMANDAKTSYQIEAPPGGFEYLALNGRAFAIFDGLDEIIDISSRQELVHAIESFCRQYPATPVLVTSRPVGYEHAPLDPRMFETFTLFGFSERKVRQYVTSWFELDDELTPKDRNDQISAFMDESKRVNDLRSNPLMLSLLCSLHRGIGYIPKNRPDVYEKCTSLLFERWWDDRRGIKVEIPFDGHMRPTVMFLAHWIFADSSLQEGVPRRKWIDQAVRYLCPRRFEDEMDASRAAASFMDFCSGRAWVLSNAGTTESGERMFKFTHRTFLEYFTAGHLARTYESPEKLLDHILVRIEQSQWDVPAQLSLHIKHQTFEDVGERVLPRILERIESRGLAASHSLISFAIRALEYLVPSPIVLREVAAVAFRSCVAAHAPRDKQTTLLIRLRDVARDNAQVVSAALLDIIPLAVKAGDESRAVFAIQFARSFSNLMRKVRRGQSNMWWEIEKDVFHRCDGRLDVLWPNSYGVSEGMLRLGKLPVSKFIEAHGVSRLFKRIGSFLFDATAPSHAEYLVAKTLLFEFVRDEHLASERLKHDLTLIGRILLRAKRPWVSEHEKLAIKDELMRLILLSEKHRQRSFDLSNDALFGALCLLAGLLSRSRPRDVSFVRIFKGSSTFLRWAKAMIAARNDRVRVKDFARRLDSSGFQANQKKLLLEWCTGDFLPYENLRS